MPEEKKSIFKRREIKEVSAEKPQKIRKYPWALMECGDSFFVPNRSLRSFRGSLYDYNNKGDGKQFCGADYVENGVSGTRIWRMDNKPPVVVREEKSDFLLTLILRSIKEIYPKHDFDGFDVAPFFEEVKARIDETLFRLCDVIRQSMIDNMAVCFDDDGSLIRPIPPMPIEEMTIEDRTRWEKYGKLMDEVMQ